MTDQTSPDPHARPDVLGLGSILVSSLPAALLTDEEPKRYTVEAERRRRRAAAEHERAAAVVELARAVRFSPDVAGSRPITR